MTTNLPKRQAPQPDRSVIEWLLDSDPSIRWQVMRDLTDAPAHEISTERARAATVRMPRTWRTLLSNDSSPMIKAPSTLSGANYRLAIMLTGQ